MDHNKLILFVLVALASFVQNSYAFAPGQFPVSTVGNLTTFGSGTVGGGTLGSGAITFASDGTLLSKGPVSFTGAGGSKVTAELTSKVSKAATAKALANFAFKGLPLLGTAVALYQLYDELGFGKGPAGTPFNMGLPGMWATDYSDFIYNSREEACASLYNRPGARFLGYYPSVHFGGADRCNVSFDAEGYSIASNMRFRATSTTPVLTSPVTRQEFENAVAAKSGWPSSSSMGTAAKNALDSGEVVQAQPESLAGPLASPGQQTTTTNPDGTTTTTTTTNNYVYNGPNVTVTTTTITQNFNTSGAPAGNPTVTTTKPGQPAQPAEVPEPEPEKDLCEKNPTIAACAKLDVPDATPIQNKDISVSITPDSGWGPSTGSCPAPRPLALHGLTTEFSWQPMCDFASGIRGVILAVAWLIAAGSVIGLARKD